MVRRELFEGELLKAVYVRARSTSDAPGDVERQTANVVVLPLTGVFAKHDGPRSHTIVTPNHATLIARGAPYRLSLPGAVGDECLTLRFAPDALARVAPEVMNREGFDMTQFAAQVLLPPQLGLARSVLWRCCINDACDPLQVEELAVGVLVRSLALARKHPVGTRAHTPSAQRRRITRVIEAVSIDPTRKWTLASLADLTGVSPWHLAHGFRAATGLSLYQYVLSARLAHTLPAVLESGAELSSIAADAGFTSHSHFTARFRAAFGWAPADLRRHANGRVARELRKIMTANAEMSV
jgi:AraC-like DNA-binding protein